jgi:streptogramin lyase
MKYYILITACILLACVEAKAQNISTFLTMSSNNQVRSLISDHQGNLFYIDQSNWPFVIKKVTSNGTVSTFISGDYYFNNITADGSGNLYFFDENTYEIKKVSSAGEVNTYYMANNIYPTNLTSDLDGNLYFFDQYEYAVRKLSQTADLTTISYDGFNNTSFAIDNNGNVFYTNYMEIRKVDNNGTETSFKYGDFYESKMAIDADGNFYYTEYGELKMIDSNGNESNITYDISNDTNLAVDALKNLFFSYEDYSSGNSKIKVLIIDNSICLQPADPTADNVEICSGITANLTATNLIGDLEWYDAATNGNLLFTGTTFTTPTLNSSITYYVRSKFCTQTSQFIAVNVNVLARPIAAITGDLTGNDFVRITASGGNTYLWNGGSAATSGINVFNRSGNYTVTVSNTNGCTDVISFNVTITKYGVSKTGKLTTDFSGKITSTGDLNANTTLNRFGKVLSTYTADGILTYKVFTSPGSHPYNATQLDAYVNPANQTSTGTYSANTLINWTVKDQLTAVGISIPNGGDRFSVQVDGFFIPEESGVYTFTCEGDDAVDLFINGINVANHYGGHGINALGTHTGTINLTAGERYNLRARMQENGGGEGLRVFWRRPSETSGWNLYPSEISSQ